MARKKKTDEPKVRHMQEGPDINHDGLIDFIEECNREDSERASSAGETRQAIGEFIESTGMNSKALAWCRQILKAKNQSKQMDIIMSLEKALPMIKDHVSGQGTAEMELEDQAPPPDTGPTGDDDFDRDLNAGFPDAAE